jgi:hypothetical protein
LPAISGKDPILQLSHHRIFYHKSRVFWSAPGRISQNKSFDFFVFPIFYRSCRLEKVRIALSAFRFYSIKITGFIFRLDFAFVYDYNPRRTIGNWFVGIKTQK